MKTSPLYNLPHLAKSSITAIAVLGSSAHAAIWWDSTTSAAYTANNNLTFTVDDDGQQFNGAGDLVGDSFAFQGIEVEASADAAGNDFRALGGAGGNLLFRNADALATGDSITFTFCFNMQLFSGSRQFGAVGSGIRAAAMFRVNTSDVVGAVDTKMEGGNSTLQTYFGTAPTAGSLSHTNPGIIQYNTGGSASFQGDSEFDSFVDADTARFTEFLTTSPDPGGVDTDTEFAVAFTDDPRVGPDFAYDKWTFTFTNTAATALAANTEFRFTFEGQNFAAQQAAVAPEPSSAILFSLGALGILTRRKR